jgi:hypothetical protein
MVLIGKKFFNTVQNKTSSPKSWPYAEATQSPRRAQGVNRCHSLNLGALLTARS